MSLAWSEWGKEQYKLKLESRAVTRLSKTELLITLNISALNAPNLFFPQKMILSSALLINQKMWILHWVNSFLDFSIDCLLPLLLSCQSILQLVVKGITQKDYSGHMTAMFKTFQLFLILRKKCLMLYILS